MNKYFLSLITLMMILAGCASESSIDDSFLGTKENPEALILPSGNQLDPDLQNTIDELQAFNDSILATQPDANIQSISQKEWDVVNADAAGFLFGLRYGWKNGKGFFGKLATSASCAVAFSAAASLMAAFNVYIISPILGTNADCGLMANDNSSIEFDNPYTYTQFQFGIVLGAKSNKYEVELINFKNSHPLMIVGDTVAMRNAVLHNQIIENISTKTYPPQLLKAYFTDNDISFLNQSSTINFYKTIPYRYRGIISAEFSEPLYDREYTYAKEILDHFNSAVGDIKGSIHGVGMTTLHELAARYISSTNGDRSKISQQTIREIQTGIYLTVMSAEYWRVNGRNFKIKS